MSLINTFYEKHKKHREKRNIRNIVKESYFSISKVDRRRSATR